MARNEGAFGARNRDQAQMLALMVENVLDYAIFLLDPEGNIATWNRGAERTKGYTAQEIVGRHFSVFYTPEDVESDHPNDNLKIARREGRFEEEGWRVRKDGSRFWANVVITCLRDEDGQILGFGKVTRDLTARRLAEQHLEENARDLRQANADLEQFRRLVLHVRDYAIYMLDPGGHITTWNVGAEHIKGYTSQEVIGRHFSMFYTEEDRVRNHPGRELEIAAREGRYEEEGWRVRKDGTTFWASVVITAVRSEQGILLGYAKVTRDLTERRESEEALHRANDELERKNEELDRFASVAAHDLREPLRTIGGFSELLLARYNDVLDDRGQTFLDHIVQAVGRMQRLVDELLEYARGGDVVHGEPLEVGRCLSAVLTELHGAIEQRGAQLEVALEDGVRVLAHPGDVEAVLRNFVSNAVKFSDHDAPHVSVRSVEHEDGWRIEVQDNGIGIDPADRPRIFRAFQRLHSAAEFPGTGLGLAIAQRVVERNGGSIGVESSVGQGSCFWFWLPRA